MPRKIREEFESNDYEDINYRYADTCLLCDHVDSQRMANKQKDGVMPVILYFCHKHKEYVNTSKVCDQFKEE